MNISPDLNYVGSSVSRRATVNEPEPPSELNPPILRPVFVSYSTADRKQALAVCKAIENRGTPCWISTRDVALGENYQEAIVRSIRNARAVALIFSKAANDSDEIKKELSLASRYRVPVMALRVQDVEPSDAFAYELSTRQWIDAFEGWDRSIDSLVSRIEQLPGEQPAATEDASPDRRRSTFSSRRSVATAALAGISCLSWLPGRGGLYRTPPRRTACQSASPGSNCCLPTCPPPRAKRLTPKLPRRSTPMALSTSPPPAPRPRARRRLMRLVGRSSASAARSASSPASPTSAVVPRFGPTKPITTVPMRPKSRATSRLMPATSFAADCSAPPPTNARCPTACSGITSNFARGIGIPSSMTGARRWSPRNASSLRSPISRGAGRRLPGVTGKSRLALTIRKSQSRRAPADAKPPTAPSPSTPETARRCGSSRCCLIATTGPRARTYSSARWRLSGSIAGASIINMASCWAMSAALPTR
ncbi:MAG: toll/interleukin-1 receptor domain-containing protein [Sphingomonas sp.]|nr:toll/interleukin-1 receptor domain-containing protein [Sphingomonas sp.]